jgi:hypothetical protein
MLNILQLTPSADRTGKQGTRPNTDCRISFPRRASHYSSRADNRRCCMSPYLSIRKCSLDNLKVSTREAYRTED